MNSETSDRKGFHSERASRCAEQSRRHVDARVSSLSSEEKAARERAFNLELSQLVQSGRFQK